MEIEVVYMSGAGNLFSVIDNRIYKFSQQECSTISKKLCDKSINKLINTEGLLVLDKGDDANDFTCYYFNPDGTFNMMCGNGGRCAILFCMSKKFFAKDNFDLINFNMQGIQYSGRILFERLLNKTNRQEDTTLIKSEVELYMPPPCKIVNEMNLCIYDEIWNVTYVDVNSDHIVVDVAEIECLKNIRFEEIDVMKYGRAIRFNEALESKGANANFYILADDGKIYLRTYERGVEKETGACGTGAVSTALAAVLNEQKKLRSGNKGSDNRILNFPVTVIPRSKSPLEINIAGKLTEEISTIILKGEAEIISSCKVILENIKNSK